MSVSVIGNILNLRARVALQERLKHGRERLMGAQRGSALLERILFLCAIAAPNTPSLPETRGEGQLRSVLWVRATAVKERRIHTFKGLTRGG